MSADLAEKTATADSVSEDVLRHLQEQTGDEDGELLNELVEVFVTDAQETCTKMQELLAAGNATQLSREGHRLKSGAANLGATHMTALCKEIEHRGNAQDLTVMPQLIADLTSELVRVEQDLNAYLSKLQSA